MPCRYSVLSCTGHYRDLRLFRLGIPLTHRDLPGRAWSPVTLRPAASWTWENLAVKSKPGVYMGLNQADDPGKTDCPWRKADMPAAIVAKRNSDSTQKVVTGTLEQWMSWPGRWPTRHDCVGQRVVGLRDKLNWFSSINGLMPAQTAHKLKARCIAPGFITVRQQVLGA